LELQREEVPVQYLYDSLSCHNTQEYESREEELEDKVSRCEVTRGSRDVGVGLCQLLPPKSFDKEYEPDEGGFGSHIAVLSLYFIPLIGQEKTAPNDNVILSEVLLTAIDGAGLD
jgi:hypothetical protein